MTYFVCVQELLGNCSQTLIFIQINTLAKVFSSNVIFAIILYTNRECHEPSESILHIESVLKKIGTRYYTLYSSVLSLKIKSKTIALQKKKFNDNLPKTRIKPRISSSVNPSHIFTIISVKS